jgi:hypothetical protein
MGTPQLKRDGSQVLHTAICLLLKDLPHRGPIAWGPDQANVFVPGSCVKLITATMAMYGLISQFHRDVICDITVTCE